MSDDENMLKKRFIELSERAFSKNIYTFTEFLSPAEQNLLRYTVKGVPYRFEGGFENAEKALCVFGSEELCGYEGFAPIEFIKIEPCSMKFSGELAHRDFLGSLMGCGVAREAIGDICVGTGFCDFFVTEEIAPYLLQNFSNAGRTKFHLSAVSLRDAQIPEPEVKIIKDTLASLRLDGVVSSGFRISRSLAAQYILAGKAAVDGLPCEKPDKQVTEGCKISIRGSGKIKLYKINGQTKKNRISIEIHRYV